MIQPADYVERILQMIIVAHVYGYYAMVRTDNIMEVIDRYWTFGHSLYVSALRAVCWVLVYPH